MFLLSTLTIPLGTCILLETLSSVFKHNWKKLPCIYASAGTGRQRHCGSSFIDHLEPGHKSTSVLTCVKIPYSDFTIMDGCDSTTSQKLYLFENTE